MSVKTNNVWAWRHIWEVKATLSLPLARIFSNKTNYLQCTMHGKIWKENNHYHRSLSHIERVGLEFEHCLDKEEMSNNRMRTHRSIFSHKYLNGWAADWKFRTKKRCRTTEWSSWHRWRMRPRPLMFSFVHFVRYWQCELEIILILFTTAVYTPHILICALMPSDLWNNNVPHEY